MIAEKPARRKALSDSELSLPDVAGLSLLEAAVAYAEAGWYVLPTDPADIKNPGSVVKGRWHEKSSRDPEQIRRWWSANPNYGIALHCGRSGAGVFDFDMDSLGCIDGYGLCGVADALRAAGAVQATRRDGDRGHYMFLLPDGGKEYGNSAGAFTLVGEFRGKNGVIIAAPTPHPDADTKGGDYRQVTTGPLGRLPNVLRECLTEAGETADPLSDAEMDAFPDTHTADGCGRESCRHTIAGQVTQLRQRIADGASRHESLVSVAPWAFAEAMAGCYPAREAFGTLHRAYAEHFDPDTESQRVASLGAEYLRIVQWAMAVAVADPDRAHRNDGTPTDAELEAFWSSRPELERLRTFARARCVGPWSTFGAVLARVIATIPPNVVLPPTIGSEGSLNLFVALVAPSGFGKNTSEAAAEAFVAGETYVHVATPGSGEGIPKQYAYKKKAEQINQRNAVLFTVSEVDTFAALAGRSGSTLMPELRKAWMGERLGFGYADVEKAVAIMAHRYRMTMVVGVQPGRGATLLKDADGGTPQRFIWLPTTDPNAPDEPPEEPEPLALPAWPSPGQQRSLDTDGDTVKLKFGPVDVYRLDTPVNKDEFHVLVLPPSVVEAVRGEQRAKLRGEASGAKALDAHATLARLKVAVGLMWMNGRTDKVSEEDWELAGVVMGVSNSVRAEVQAALRSNAVKSDRERGRRDADREVARTERPSAGRSQSAAGVGFAPPLAQYRLRAIGKAAFGPISTFVVALPMARSRASRIACSAMWSGTSPSRAIPKSFCTRAPTSRCSTTWSGSSRSPARSPEPARGYRPTHRAPYPHLSPSKSWTRNSSTSPLHAPLVARPCETAMTGSMTTPAPTHPVAAHEAVRRAGSWRP